MDSPERKPDYISFASLFGENSMEAFIQRLTENRYCVDCKTAIEGLEGATELHTQFTERRTEIVGHYCAVCRKRREEVMCHWRLRLAG